MREARYLQIVADLRRRIAAGELRPGARVPSTRQIIRRHRVAMATATKVLATLRHEGLVEAVPGVGTVVASAPPAARGAARETTGGLGADRVVRTAIEIADREGIAALSMRRIAADLGAAAMSIYRHVPSKEDLVFRMTDAVFADEPPPELPRLGWRAKLERLGRLQWAMYRRHPWLAQVISMTRPLPVPAAMAHTEAAMRALDNLGLDAKTIFYAAVGLASCVRGTAINLEPEAEAEQQTGLSREEWLASQSAAIDSVAPRFPVLMRIAGDPGVELDLDELFEFGLQRFLDGLAVLIRAR